MTPSRLPARARAGVRGRTGCENPSGIRPPGFYGPVHSSWPVRVTENPGTSFVEAFYWPAVPTAPPPSRPPGSWLYANPPPYPPPAPIPWRKLFPFWRGRGIIFYNLIPKGGDGCLPPLTTPHVYKLLPQKRLSVNRGPRGSWCPVGTVQDRPNRQVRPESP